MKEYRKRIISAVLTAAMAFSSVGVTAYAEGLAEGESVEVSVDGGVSVNTANFPDEKFRSYVSDNFDSDGDGSLSGEEIQSVTNINLEWKSISNLKGIEYFTKLTDLDCSYNQLASLDVSNNTALTNLNCSDNELTSLDVSKNTALKTLSCSFNQLTSLDVSNNTALTGLDCSDNQLTSLDVSNNTALNELNCDCNQLTSIDVSNNTALTKLECYDNRLTSLDVSNNTALESLCCNYNQLTSLDVSKNTALTELLCFSNELTSLDLSNNTALTYLDCYYNQLTSLDVSKNTALTDLKCNYNQLTSLDVSNNTALINLVCGDNQLTSLDLSANTNLSELYCERNVYELSSNSLDELTGYGFDPSKASGWTNAYYNPETNSLKITSDKITYTYDTGNGMSVKFALIVPETVVCEINEETFPDEIFRNYVLSEFDTYSNGCLTDKEINNATSISIAYSGVESLKGVEYFTELIELDCDNNQLTSLDVSKNTALTELHCYNNQLESLDVSNNTALTYLDCSVNQLTSLDVSNNTALTDLECGGNQLTSLDVSNNTALKTLSCGGNPLTSLDVSNNTALTDLECSGNQLTSLDLSNNTALAKLHCIDNMLTSLDVSNNTALTDLNCDSNQLTSLDVSNNTALTELECYHNQLTSLDVSKNTALTFLSCFGNHLTSLDVSNNTALTHLNCEYNQLTSLDVSDDTALTFLDCGGNYLTSLDVSNNTALGVLDCDYNQLTSLDVSKNTALVILDCSRNQLTSLDVSKNTALTDLDCDLNQLTSLELSANTNLWKLSCYGNAYTLSSKSLDELTKYGFDPSKASEWTGARYDAATNSLVNVTDSIVTYIYDVGNDTSELFTLVMPETVVCEINEETFPDETFRNYILDNFDANGDGSLSDAEINNVSQIEVSGKKISTLKGIEYFTNLTYLDCSQNGLTTLDVSKNTDLVHLDCAGNSLASLDVSKNTKLTYLDCSVNLLTSLDVTKNTALVTLIASVVFEGGKGEAGDDEVAKTENNAITEIDLSNNHALETLKIRGNKLTSLDLSGCPKLTNLWCSVNKLTSLDVSSNLSLDYLRCSRNQITTLDVTKNTALRALYCDCNKLTSLNTANNTALLYLNCGENQLAKLDVSKNAALIELKCYDNAIKALDLSGNTKLSRLNCNGNKLTSLDLSGNDDISFVDCSYNKYTLSTSSLDELKQYGFDPAKASEWTGASYNAATNSLTGITSESVTYKYDLGKGYSAKFTLGVTLPKVPDKPTNVKATPGDKQVTLSWTAATGATSYTIYKYENGKYAKINSTASTTYTVTGLTNGTTYKFLVRAFNATGGNAFTTADLVSATPKAAVVSVPSKPTNVKATAGDKQVTLSWSAATGAASYTIYRYDSGKYTKLTSTTKTTYTVTGLTNGTTYKFLVRAFNSAGGNSFTTADLVSATPKAAATTVPAKPTVSANVQDKVVTFSWNAVTGATYYKLYNYSNGKYGLIATATDTTYRLRYLKNGTTYKVLVRAFNEKGGSAFTTADLITVTPKAATAVPTAPSVKASVSGGNVNLTWAHVPTAFSYTIYKYENGTYTKLGATCDNYFTVKGLAAGKTYSILVRAFNSKGGHKVTSADRVSVTL